jgi:uncharacterized membrane protein
MSTDDDQLVEDYLARLHTAARSLPAERRAELVEEITAHIAEARMAGPSASPVDVRNILDRLGDPADIVRMATEAAPGDPAWSAAEAIPGSSGWSTADAAGTGHPAPAAAQPGRIGAMEVVTVLLLLLGGLVIPVLGWFAGVVLLWVSPRWTRKDKVLATLIWPGGLLAPVVVTLAGGVASLMVTSSETCVQGTATAPGAGGQTAAQTVTTHCVTNGFSFAPWMSITLAIVLMTAAIAGPVWIAMRLLRRARQSPAQAVIPAPTDLIPA